MIDEVLVNIFRIALRYIAGADTPTEALIAIRAELRKLGE